ncbi:hypothetical protein M758_UG224100 [Ceratodon purpureus]|nr:hypothetical protein M758_UG224100 [Ceratodon purpureus]
MGPLRRRGVEKPTMGERQAGSQLPAPNPNMQHPSLILVFTSYTQAGRLSDSLGGCLSDFSFRGILGSMAFGLSS